MTAKNNSNSVVTYQYAYVTGEVSLCDRHAAAPDAPLGRVSRGRHYGRCEMCDADPAITDGDIRRLRREAEAAGDNRQAYLCLYALEGSEAARAECARVIAAARAMED